MDLQKINTILANFENFRNDWARKRLPDILQGTKLVDSKVEKSIDDEANRGDEGISYEIYQLPFDDLYLKFEIRTDSYGDNERVTSMQFVTPKKKEITVYETIYE